ncbi:hypothetical protein IV417_04870 [Alphaproteobacteria bacterium KMM 3653]|uniref:Uncharacterized protein n=1 Tax=Harenicola maris TaxID=2841044 RepID=A0AAP2CMS0_9RHOB|nr:hypothetical protein [Harenicola maris]
MALLDELADELAIDALRIAEENGDERLVRDVAASLGMSSPTMEETFMTCVRVRSAAIRARRFLEQREKSGPPKE